MVRAGVDVTEIYRRLGVEPRRLMEPGVRHPHRYQAVFWSAVEAVSADPEIGLHLCPFLSPFAGEVLMHLFASSPTLGEGISRVLQHARLLSDHLSLRLQTGLDGPDVALVSCLGDATTPRHSEITFFCGLLQSVRAGSGGLFSPSRIELRSAAIAAVIEYERVFGCPVSFESAETRCWFPRAQLDLSLPHCDPEVALAHEMLVQRRIRRLLKRDRVRRVRSVVVSRLEGGVCSLGDVAAELRVSPRQLRKDLLDAGTNFNEIVSDARRSLAKRLLLTGDESIARIAEILGFSERSAFFRAFKNWTGLTPGQFRRRLGKALNRSGHSRSPPDVQTRTRSLNIID